MLSHDVVWLIHAERQREIERQAVAAELRRALQAAQRYFGSVADGPVRRTVGRGRAITTGQR